MWTFLSRGAAESPFALSQEPISRLRKAGSASLAIHLLVVLLLAWPAKPVFVKPNLLARGAGGTSSLTATPVYLPRELQAHAEARPAQLSLRAIASARKSKVSHQRHNVVEEEKPRLEDKVEIGSKQGSGLDGPAFGDEVKPALPLDFAEPTIRRSELPGGLQGDVVVEITIDEQGKVSEERLLQGLGHGIDEKVIAAVHDWHFRPATRNGVAIPSKHDVHFHFPS